MQVSFWLHSSSCHEHKANREACLETGRLVPERRVRRRQQRIHTNDAAIVVSFLQTWSFRLRAYSSPVCAGCEQEMIAQCFLVAMACQIIFCVCMSCMMVFLYSVTAAVFRKGFVLLLRFLKRMTRQLFVMVGCWVDRWLCLFCET